MGIEKLRYSAFRPLGEEVELNGHAYQLILSYLPWEEMNRALERAGMGLACVTSEEEEQFLEDHMRSLGLTKAYIGLSRNGEGDWCWTSGEPFAYSSWGTGEPGETSDESVGMFWVGNYETGCWNDTTGDVKLPYLCEWEMVPDETEPAGGAGTVSEEQPAVKLTEDLETAGAVCDDVKAFASSEEFAEMSEEEQLKAIESLLQEDERVSRCEVRDGYVFYLTDDKIPCVYMPPFDDYLLGSASGPDGDDANISFEDSEESAAAYEAWLENGNVTGSPDGLYLDGKNAVTNRKMLTLSPALHTENTGWDWYDNSLAWLNGLHKSTDVYEKMASEYASQLGYETECLRDRDAVLKLMSGDLTDYGIICLICHGGAFRRSGGGYTSLYFLGNYAGGTDAFTRELSEQLQGERGSGKTVPADDFYLLSGQDFAEARLLVNSDRSIVVTSNYFMERFADSSFDNTLVYFGACYGAIDERLGEFFTSHGAKAFFGYDVSISQPVERATFKRLFHNLLKKEKTGSDSLNRLLRSEEMGWGEKLLQGGASVIGGYAVEGGISAWHMYGIINDWKYADANHSILTLASDIADEFVFKEQNPYIFGDWMSLTAYTARPDFSLKHSGKLSGTVKAKWTDHRYDPEGNRTSSEMTDEPGKPVEITFDRYLNQSFGEGDHITVNTDAKGIFSQDRMQWGVYGVQLSGETIEQTTGGMTFTGDAFKDDITVNATHAVYRQPVMIREDEDDEPEPAEGAYVTFELLSAEDQEQDGTLNGHRYEARTAASGIFELKGIPGGTYAVTVEAEEAEPYETTLVLENGARYDHEDPVILEKGGDPGDYYAYIHENMEPELGYVKPKNGGTMSDLSGLWGTLLDIQSGMTNAQKAVPGLLSADVADLDLDGTDDCIVCYVSAKEAGGLEVRAKVLCTDDDGKIYEAADEKVSDVLDGVCNYIAGGVEERAGGPCFYIENYLSEYTSAEPGEGGVYYSVWNFSEENGLTEERLITPEMSGEEAYEMMLSLPSMQYALSGMFGGYSAGSFYDIFSSDLTDEEMLGLLFGGDMGQTPEQTSYGGPAQSFIYFTVGKDYVITMEDDTMLREVIEERYG